MFRISVTYLKNIFNSFKNTIKKTYKTIRNCQKVLKRPNKTAINVPKKYIDNNQEEFSVRFTLCFMSIVSRCKYWIKTWLSLQRELSMRKQQLWHALFGHNSRGWVAFFILVVVSMIWMTFVFLKGLCNVRSILLL